MNMSYYTDSTLLQTMMENPLEKKADRCVKPGLKLSCFTPSVPKELSGQGERALHLVDFLVG